MTPQQRYHGHAACPLSDHLGWEEGEDLEWCARAFGLGYVSDIVLGAEAVSSTSRYKARPALGVVEPAAEYLVRRGRVAKAWALDGLGRLTGSR